MCVPYVWVATPLTSRPYNLSHKKAPDLRGGGGWGLGRMGGETDVGESRQTILILF